MTTILTGLVLVTLATAGAAAGHWFVHWLADRLAEAEWLDTTGATTETSAGAEPVSDRKDAATNKSGADRTGEPAPAAGPEAPADNHDPHWSIRGWLA